VTGPDGASAAAAEVAALIAEWVTRGWHLQHGERWDSRRQLEPFYDWRGDDILLHDNADPHRTLARSAAEYAEIWDAALVTLVALENTIDDGPHVTVSGDLAVVDVCFSSRFDFGDGRVEVAPTRSTLALRRQGPRWVIFREHGSALSPHE
jgi:ketosteroid isomerase-like protein